eukprot:20003-Heterococcus_DN1.PRE.3
MPPVPPCESASDETCLRALHIVAREGWLCKAGWSISKAVHAFAKPTKARLTSSIDIVNAVLARPLVTALQLEGDLGSSPPPLPAGLRTLELIRFSGTLDQLPQSLTSLTVFGWRGAAGIAAIVRAFEAAPAGLQLLDLKRRSGLLWRGVDALAGAQCPASVTTLRLQGVGWCMNFPSQLRTLTLSLCVIETELQLPDNVRKLEFVSCSVPGPLLLNEGLQRLHLTENTTCSSLVQLPSTLTHLVMDASSNVTIAQPLPASLKYAFLGKHSDPSLVLPDTLEELVVGRSFSQPLGPLPLGLRSLEIANSDFDHPLGDLPDQLRKLQLSYWFDQHLGPLPQSLETLVMGYRYSHPLPLPLPSNLRKLCMGYRFNHSLGPLPQSLAELVVGASFDHDLRPLPQSLTVLDLSQAGCYDHPLPPPAERPAGLHTLKLTSAWRRKHWPDQAELVERQQLPRLRGSRSSSSSSSSSRPVSSSGSRNSHTSSGRVRGSIRLTYNSGSNVHDAEYQQ